MKVRDRDREREAERERERELEYGCFGLRCGWILIPDSGWH